MLELIIENILNNKDDIRIIKRKINEHVIDNQQSNKLIMWNLIMLAGGFYLMYRIIKTHDNEIEKIKHELKEIKSKGE